MTLDCLLTILLCLIPWCPTWKMPPLHTAILALPSSSAFPLLPEPTLNYFHLISTPTNNYSAPPGSAHPLLPIYWNLTPPSEPEDLLHPCLITRLHNSCFLPSKYSLKFFNTEQSWSSVLMGPLISISLTPQTNHIGYLCLGTPIDHALSHFNKRHTKEKTKKTYAVSIHLSSLV